MNYKYIRLLVSVVPIGYVVGRLSWPVLAQGPITAYTVEYTSSALNSDGTAARPPEHQFVARRADGSEVRGTVIELPALQPSITKTIQFTDRGVKVFAHGLSQSTSTTRLSASQMQELRLRGSSDRTCTSWPPLVHPNSVIGEGEMLGFKLVKLRRTDGLGSLPATTEEWRSPDLDCEVLYQKIDFVSPDTHKPLMIEVKAVTAKLGDPDESFFKVSSDYNERSPSEIVSLAAKLEGLGLSPQTKTKLQTADTRYASNKGTPIQSEPR